MIIKLNINQKQEGLLKHWSPWTRDSESTSLGWGLKIRIFNKFPSDTDVNNQSPLSESHQTVQSVLLTVSSLISVHLGTPA